MFPELRLLHQELNAFNRIGAKEKCVIVVANIVWIGQTIVIHNVRFPRVDAHLVEHFV